MESFWPVLPIVLVGLAVAVLVRRRRRRAQHPPVTAGAQPGEPAAAAVKFRGAPGDAGAHGDRGDVSGDAGASGGAGAAARRRCEQRCEQAVRRCLRAVEAITAESARSELMALVRRMDAELPTVRALAALADELAAGSEGRAATQVDEGLDETARGFDELAAEVLALIDELPRLSGRQRTSERAARLRNRFPLAPPMSAFTGGGEVGVAGERGGQALRAG